MDKKTYPVKDGWLHAKVKYTPGTAMTAEAMLAFFGCNSETHEVAKFTAFKTCANLVFRRRRGAVPS